jgi:tetratricopeptide (TPR) repeat protein
MSYRSNTISEALQWMREALDLARGLGDRWVEQAMLVQVGRGLFAAGDLAGAYRCLEEAMQIAESLDSDNCRFYALFHRASLEMRTNDLDAAAADIDRAIQLATDSGDPRLQGDCHYLRADLRLMQGNTAAARADINETIRLHRRIGLRAEVAAGLARLACVEMADGDLEQARASLAEASGQAPRGSQAMQEVVHTFGELDQLNGDFGAARDHFNEALAAWPDEPSSLVRAHRGLGRLALLDGDTGLALGHYASALGSPSNEVTIRTLAVHIAALAVACDRRDLAAECFAASGPADDPYLYVDRPVLSLIRKEVVAALTDAPSATSPSATDVQIVDALLRRVVDELAAS